MRVDRDAELLGTDGHGPMYAPSRRHRRALRHRHGRRRLPHVQHAAIDGHGVPLHLSTDHDLLFEAHRWLANLRILEIAEIKTVPHVPLSHPFVERLIGTVRREFLDHVLFWNGRDLERKLVEFQAYYNEARCHAALDGYTPLTVVGGRTIAPDQLNAVRWVFHCRDLVQLPVAA